jgi:hypothetical protein
MILKVSFFLKVFLYMYGTEKNWSSIHLSGRINQTSSTFIDGFPSGSIRTFCLKGPDIGQLHHLNVNVNKLRVLFFIYPLFVLACRFSIR